MADINVYGALRSMTGEGKVAYASQVYDENLNKFQSEINQEGGGGGGGTANAVLYTQQTLTSEQKQQARTNIGAGTYSKPLGGIPASDLESGVIPDVSGKENTSNKTSDISSNKTSTTKYPTTKGVADYVDGIVGDIETLLASI